MNIHLQPSVDGNVLLAADLSIPFDEIKVTALGTYARGHCGGLHQHIAHLVLVYQQ